jgi:integrase
MPCVESQPAGRFLPASCRCQTLRHWYHPLEGERAPTPVDGVKPLPVPNSPKILVPAAVFRTVAANLTEAKTRARFQVIASTGVRPAELKRAEPSDVDLDRRVWIVRAAKGGEPRAFWLNDDMVAAWEAFLARGWCLGPLRRQRLRQGALCGWVAARRAALSGAAQCRAGARRARDRPRRRTGMARAPAGKHDAQALRSGLGKSAEAGERESGRAVPGLEAGRRLTGNG